MMFTLSPVEGFTPTKKVAIGAIVVIILAILTWLGLNRQGMLLLANLEPTPTPTLCPNFKEAIITVGEKQMQVALADTANERSRGLSNCADIPANSGMYFTFPEAREVVFWMKDMRMPLDIMWITNGTIVGIAENVPAPLSRDIPDDELPTYTSPGAVTAVLEIPGGQAHEQGIVVGNQIVQH